MRGFALLVAAIAALGGLLFGYDTGVISGAVLFIARDFALSTRLHELTVSIVLAGAVVGSAVAGSIADRIGRRATLLWAGAIFAVAALASSAAPNIGSLLAARTLVGVAIGLSSVIAPLYISEIAPAAERGGLVSLYQFAITIGIFASFLLDFALSPSGAWRWMLGLGAVPALILVSGMFVLPETPRFLFKIGRTARARHILERIATPEDAVVEEQAIDAFLRERPTSRRDVLAAPAVRAALFIGIGLAVLQQITGINTVIYYGPQIFTLAGVDSSRSAILATAWVGGVNMLLTLVAIFLVDRVGRKPLLYAGCSGMFVALSALTYAFSRPDLHGSLSTIALVSLMVYVGCFAFSLGPIVWLLISEIFPLQARGIGMSICTLANWVANFLVSRFFLTMIAKLGTALTFGVYAALCIVTIIFVARLVPETKRQALEDVRVAA